MCAKIDDALNELDPLYQSLLEGNKQFIEDSLKIDPEYFTTLAKGQAPPVLWIGCADSRVPANQITNTAPGQIFVHRNIANMVIHSDMNMLSVLDYAVNVLKVKHVIVTGHYGCGGVIAAMGNQQFGLIDNWLRHIKDVYRLHAAKLDAIADMDERCDRLVEYNVIENVRNLCKTSIVQNAWKIGQPVGVHGWVYSLKTGVITDMKVSAYDNANMDNVFKFK
ncbi:carbonic anhydrase [Mucilaginibacter gotjawali]|uniref:Carbonic anhydrase n=2 Tax=Mucilaginibacter gotjawali TaxID=1550579 RepID=A0A839SKJ7_9SPHI|nr:carbonic anhydrase [Mucilaginibacter gotjawali]MBB3057400.1 carbonic anhydrase [Mucilaginibacter gotjawali]BAU55481.1 Carbonic anhydrase 2 [Mucilaginibacter gotjawali]